MNLKLDRPLAVLDIESTGINKRLDRIIDLAIVKLLPDGSREAFTFRVNPEMPIPPVSTAVHGITDEDVKESPKFSEVAADVAGCLEGCDLAGFNSINFDIPLLQEEFSRADVPFDIKGRRLVDAQRIYHEREPRDLSAALQFYSGEEHADAHGALADVEATIKVIEGQLERYDDLPRDVGGLDALCNPHDPDWVDETGKLKWDIEGDIVINFGQNIGRKLKELARYERGFLDWILRKDFPRDTQDIVRSAIAGSIPTKTGDS